MVSQGLLQAGARLEHACNGASSLVAPVRPVAALVASSCAVNGNHREVWCRAAVLLGAETPWWLSVPGAGGGCAPGEESLEWKSTDAGFCSPSDAGLRCDFRAVK